MSATTAEYAARFIRLFDGARRSHGTYTAEDLESNGKKTIRRTAKTLLQPVTERMWEQHLDGTRPLGIVPINEEDTCLFGAIDIDDYTVEIPTIVSALRTANIPAVCCRTKSGGCHVYMFFSEPIPAAMLIGRLKELAAFLSHANSEIFPKQISVNTDRGDLGSWINMPYFAGDKTERYAVRPDGRGLSMDGFLTVAEGNQLSLRGLKDLRLQRQEAGFDTGPPCLESLVSTGFPPHTRNNGVLALGILAKKMNPDGWEALLKGWVDKYVADPPFPAADLASVVRSLRKKDYMYKCSDKPLNSVCNSGLCKTRPFGITGGGSTPCPLDCVEIHGSDPPLFIVTLKIGGRVQVTGKQYLSPAEFQLQVLLQLHKVIPEYKRGDWQGWTAEIIRDAKVVDSPKETTVVGKFEELLEQFVTDRHRAQRKEELLLKKPWHDEENGLVYFRMQDLEEFLNREKFAPAEAGTTTRRWIGKRLVDMGGASSQFNALGKNVRTWSLSATMFTWTQNEFALPAHEEGPL